MSNQPRFPTLLLSLFLADDTEGGIGRCISHEDTHELYIPYALLMVSETSTFLLPR